MIGIDGYILAAVGILTVLYGFQAKRSSTHSHW